MRRDKRHIRHRCTTTTEYPVPVMTDKIQDASGDHPGDNIIYHDSHAAMYIAVKPADLPRFPHIEDTENHKPGCDPLPVIGRQRHERDPHTDKFVPDNAAMIVHAHVFRRLMTKIDADTDPQHYHQRIELPGQKSSDTRRESPPATPSCQERSGLIHFRIRQQADATDYSFSGDFSRHLYGVAKWSYPFQSNVTGSPSRIKQSPSISAVICPIQVNGTPRCPRATSSAPRFSSGTVKHNS